jgi:hypothetical protein
VHQATAPAQFRVLLPALRTLAIAAVMVDLGTNRGFTRNCQDVLGRACAAKEKGAKEKGAFITYMIGQ